MAILASPPPLCNLPMPYAPFFAYYPPGYLVARVDALSEGVIGALL